MKKPIYISTGIGRFYRAVETEDFVYYCCYKEGDENGNTKMFRKDTMELVSDNYFASNDLFEVLVENKYTWLSPTIKRNFKKWIADQDFLEA